MYCKIVAALIIGVFLVSSPLMASKENLDDHPQKGTQQTFWNFTKASGAFPTNLTKRVYEFLGWSKALPIRWDLLKTQVPLEHQKTAIAMERAYAQWFTTYACLGLGCDTPILEALHQAMTPSKDELQAFYKSLMDKRYKDFGLSPYLTLGLFLFAEKNNYEDSCILDGFHRTGLPGLPDNHCIRILPPFLSVLANKKYLHLSRNEIVDITPLWILKNLERIEMNSNQIVDITPLQGLINLTYLDLMNNKIIDLTPLMGLTNLQTLCLSSNKIVNVLPLQSLINLAGLSLYDNPVTYSPQSQLSVQNLFMRTTTLYLKDPSWQHSLSGTRIP